MSSCPCRRFGSSHTRFNLEEHVSIFLLRHPMKRLSLASLSLAPTDQAVNIPSFGFLGNANDSAVFCFVPCHTNSNTITNHFPLPYYSYEHDVLVRVRYGNVGVHFTITLQQHHHHISFMLPLHIIHRAHDPFLRVFVFSRAIDGEQRWAISKKKRAHTLGEWERRKIGWHKLEDKKEWNQKRKIACNFFLYRTNMYVILFLVA